MIEHAKRFFEKGKTELKKAVDVVKEERARREREKAYREEFEAEFRYKDDDLDFVMLISAEEAKIYEKAKKKLKEVERVQSDPQILKQWQSKKYLSLHHHFSEKVVFYYERRNEDPVALHRTIRYSERLVEYAPVAIKAYRMDPYVYELPEHPGYETLIALYGEVGEWEEALRLCEKARDQGWKGDWDARIYQIQETIHKK
ncbi:hypothetical protein [Paludifilum halophilum]|uniref:Uncharacterized protein n=1 Tax=Paludifilum halophilum TaxID=1642702 RepID=A0A235BB45_9BACL|nr:hypothetical protein [Paludifilum halophilum]OYD09530.1 hypothetical protein CHM34_00480 [Paludifilum halophilum]